MLDEIPNNSSRKRATQKASDSVKATLTPLCFAWIAAALLSLPWRAA